MSDIIALTIGAMVCMAIIGYGAFVVVSIQQRTIDRLTDKLMARDLKEYVSMTQPQEKKEPAKRKPISWYDDETEIEDMQ